jgi:hypothetical protein
MDRHGYLKLPPTNSMFLMGPNRIRNRASMERQSQEREETSVQSETTEVTSGAATPRDSQISTPRSVTTTERRSYQTTTVKSSDSPPDVNQTSVSVELSPSKTVNSSVTTTTTTTKSFLEDRTPVRGMQDIIGRMKADTSKCSLHTSPQLLALRLL